MNNEIETDICIIGAGITGIIAAEKITQATGRSVLIIDAGKWVSPGPERLLRRTRYLDYRENPYPGDVLEDYLVEGAIHQTMAVGGRATHWPGIAPRYAPIDFETKTAFGLGEDWPISYGALEPYYSEAERVIGVTGDNGKGAGPRSESYPMPPFPLGSNREAIQKWLKTFNIDTWAAPVARNSIPYGGRPACVDCGTCFICPINARYSPDFVLEQMVEKNLVSLLTNTFITQLKCDRNDGVIETAIGRNLLDGTEINISAEQFLLAGSTHWTSSLLLASVSDRYPNGIANSSKCVGKYVTGHYFANAVADFSGSLYPGITSAHPLFTDQFMRAPSELSGVRYALNITPVHPKPPKIHGNIPLYGDEAMTKWRQRDSQVSFSALVEVHPHKESTISHQRFRKNRYGDPLPAVNFMAHPQSEKMLDDEDIIFADLAAKIPSLNLRKILRQPYHIAGGCRMGHNPSTSVCNDWGQCHDHENLFIVGAPACVTGGATNSTLTFCALALRTTDKVISKQL